MSPRAKILIADDHLLLAEAFRSLLEPEFQVVGIVTDGRAVVAAAEELRPHLVILDISMPQLNGLDAGDLIKKKVRGVKIVYVTMNTHPEVAAEAFRRGASGYVLKHCTAEELVVAVRRVLKGESYLPPQITKDTVEYLLRTQQEYKPNKRISTRQREVLQLLAEGKSMKEVAYILDVKAGTIAFHKYKIMEILGFTSTAQLVQYAMRQHMLA
jgi:DNA-binding NarL/FixJ family response regulator